MKSPLRNIAAIIAALCALLVPAIASASLAPTLNQTVNAGVLSSDILQTDDATPVASPTVAFSALNRSFACQTSTATLGDTNNKLNITNFGSNNGWSLAIAATGGFVSTWTAGANTYKFNDATGGTAGCTNGQLTVNPAAGTINLDCSGACTTTGVSLGSSTAFNHATTTDSVALATDSNGTAWKGYLMGIGLSQKVPASQPAGSYALPMTITITAQ